MIHYVNQISMTDQSRESMRSGGNDFPFSASEMDGNEYVNNCAKWHWHDFMEFGYVVSGILECCTPRGILRIQPGEGYFVNANVLHMNRMAAGSDPVRYRAIQFETDILTGVLMIGAKYIGPIENSNALESIHIDPENICGRKLLKGLQNTFHIAASEPEQYELHIMEQIITIWSELYSLAQPRLQESQAVTDRASARVKIMLSYIHEHYDELIGVDDIAEAADISRREAFRCFRQVLDTTPVLYLMQHRVNHGARMLLETGKTITEISLECGFSSSSYFCKAFHDLTGVSPREFRALNRMKQA